LTDAHAVLLDEMPRADAVRVLLDAEPDRVGMLFPMAQQLRRLRGAAVRADAPNAESLSEKAGGEREIPGTRTEADTDDVLHPNPTQ
jgi:hypothetical protein